MSIPDFTEVTDELVAALNIGLSDYLPATPGQLNSSVLDYPPLALDGNSPVIALHDDGAQPVDATWLRWWVGYRLSVFISRETGSDSAETLLRQMRTAVFSALRDNVQGVAYQAVEVTQKSAPAMAVLDGVNYRMEEFFFRVRVDCYGA